MASNYFYERRNVLMVYVIAKDNSHNGKQYAVYPHPIKGCGFAAGNFIKI